MFAEIKMFVAVSWNADRSVPMWVSIWDVAILSSTLLYRE